MIGQAPSGQATVLDRYPIGVVGNVTSTRQGQSYITTGTLTRVSLADGSIGSPTVLFSEPPIQGARSAMRLASADNVVVMLYGNRVYHRRFKAPFEKDAGREIIGAEIVYEIHRNEIVIPGAKDIPA